MTVCTLDPGRLPSTMTLSNGNLTWTNNGTSPGTTSACFGTLGYLAGTGVTASDLFLYFEATITALPVGDTYGPGVGIGNNRAPDSQYLGATGDGVGFYLKNGDLLIAGDHTTTYFTCVQGDIVGVAVDFVNQKLWFTKNGTTWNNDIIANQNPATNTGGTALTNQIFAPAGVFFTVYPGFGDEGVSGTSLTANFGATPFAYPLPSGFSPWAPGASLSQFMFAA